MLEYPVSQLPPQDPNDYPYIKGTCAPTGGANSVKSPAAFPPVSDVTGYPWAGPGLVYPAGTYPSGGFQPPAGAPSGYPWSVPIPVPYDTFLPTRPAPVPGFVWNDPVLTVKRKRVANRRVSLSSGIIGVVTMIVQMIITVTILLATGYLGQRDSFLILLSVLIVVVAPMIVGVGWITTFILALISCIQAHSRIPQVQPDGWTEAKMPTSALLAASIVAGTPILVMYMSLYRGLSRSSADVFIGGFLEPLLIACGLAQVLIAVGIAFLVRMSKALDPAVRAPQVEGMQVP